jgi:non-heme Fe2+,alpha-ketoglutarate-dependent halogenase
MNATIDHEAKLHGSLHRLSMDFTDGGRHARRQIRARPAALPDATPWRHTLHQTTTALSAEEVAGFRRDGFLFPMTVFSGQEVAAWADEILGLAANDVPDHPVPWRQKTYLLLPSMDALLRDRRLTDRVAAVLGEDLLALSADVFVKPPRSTGRISWHQDVNFWELAPFDVVTAWVALTPATPDNGCMRYAPAGHHGRIPHVERTDPDNILSRGQELAVTVDEATAVDVVLAPGEVAFHHALAPHASGPNVTDAPRIGVAIRYAATAVRQLAGPAISARLVRGTDRYGHFQLETGPAQPLSAAARAEHLWALEPHAATNFSTV